MRIEQVFVDNRIFDVLACATPIITDPIYGLPNGFDEPVFVVSEPSELNVAVDLALNETKQMGKRRIEFAFEVIQKHSFDNRANNIINKAREFRRT